MDRKSKASRPAEGEARRKALRTSAAGTAAGKRAGPSPAPAALRRPIVQKSQPQGAPPSSRARQGSKPGPPVRVSCHPRPLVPFDDGEKRWYCDHKSPACTRAAEGHTVRWSDQTSGYDLCRGCVEYWRERAQDEGAQGPARSPVRVPTSEAGAEDEPTAAQGGDAEMGGSPPAAGGSPGGAAPTPATDGAGCSAPEAAAALPTPAQQLLADASQRSAASEVSAAPKDALEDVPEHRLHAEVQALVVSANLESTTVGQLRAALEERLGLQVGSLGSRKSLRRRVCQLFQQEVLKKAQRGADCERIAKALVDYDDYPADVRQMLIESLPHAVRTRPLHAHQVRLLGIANDALGDYRGQLAGLLASSEAQGELAEAEERGREAARDGAAEAEAQADTKKGVANALLEEAVTEATRAEIQLEQAERMMQVAAEEVAELRRAKEAILSVSEGPFKQLVRGEWAGKEDLERTFAAVQQHFENNNAEEALMAAAAIALKQRPSERTRFDEITLSSLELTLSGHLSSCEARLAEKPEFQAESKRLAASAMLGVVVQRQDEQMAASRAAHDAHAEASAARRTAEGELVAASAAVAASRREQARLKGELDALDQTLALLARIIAGEVPSAADAEAGAVAAAEAAAAAEALAKDIICEAEPERTDAVESLDAQALAPSAGASPARPGDGADGASKHEGGGVETPEVPTQGDEGIAAEAASDVGMAPAPPGDGAGAEAEEDPIFAAAFPQEGGDGQARGQPGEAAEEDEDKEDEEEDPDKEDEEEDDEEEEDEDEEEEALELEEQAPPADAAPGSAGVARPRDAATPTRGEATRASDEGSPSCSPRRPSAKTDSERRPQQRVPTPLSPGGFPVSGRAA